MSGTVLEAAGIKDILELIPHRYPFLMVDRIINIDGVRSAIVI
jgi:3-hydroxyacyl-[acyl-carrier-protein] dehydratase